jgi:hypothetical protein
VLTGVSEPADVIRAPVGLRPTYLARDLGGLLTPHPGVTSGAAEGGLRCGGWTARLGGADGKLELSGSGDPMDGLRALCAAAWSGDEPPSADAAAAAVRQLGLPS